MTSEVIRTQWISYKKADAPSKRIWPRVIRSYEEIPSGFQEAFSVDGSELPYTVLIPEEQIAPFHEKRNAQMLCLYEDRVVILEAIHGKAASTTYPLNAILSLEHGSVLLDSWLTINAAAQSKTIRFNTVVESVFLPIIGAIRRSSKHEQASETLAVKTQQEVAKLGYLWKKNFKYFNYSKQSLLPGETIVESVYQPEIRRSTLTFFKKPVFGTALPGHVSILTDKELIFIKEKEKPETIGSSSYGGIVTYIPLQSVQDVVFEHPDDRAVDCIATFRLADRRELQFKFSTGTAVNLTAFEEACAQTFRAAQA